MQNLPEFCLERWQSLRDWRAKYNLSDSGVEPPTLEELNVNLNNIKPEYGNTKGDIELRNIISEMYKDRNSEEVLITAGGAEANFLTILSLIKEEDEIVIQMPNYMQIPGLLKGLKAKIKQIWMYPPDFKFDIERLQEIITRRTKAIIITNPNNPTGTVIDNKKIKAIAQIAEDVNAYVIADEVYRGLELNNEISTSFIDIYDKAISTNSISKVYGFSGLRIGWVIADKNLIDKMWSLRDYTTIVPSIVSQHIAKSVLENREKLIKRAKNIVLRNLKEFEEFVRNKPFIEWRKPEATPLAFFKINGVEDTVKFAEELFIRHSLLVNPGECFEMKGYIRLGLGSANFEKFREALNILNKFTDDIF
jgi:aspartate/methionine/tyrosine aminotransferase